MKIKQQYLLTFLLVIFIVQLNANENNTDIYGLLNQAFVKDKDEILDTLFIQWKTESVSISKNELSQFPKKKQLTYQLFKKYYSPITEIDNLPKDVKRKYTNSDSLEMCVPYKKPKYIVVQDVIIIGIIDSFSKTFKNDEHEIIPYLTEFDTIFNFYPDIDIEDKEILYQNCTYEIGIYNFVLTDIDSVVPNDLDFYRNRFNERLKRVFFLENHIGTILGHWGGLHVITLPEVELIVFNRKMTYAMIYYRETWFSGGQMLFFRVGSKWIKLFSRNTWME